MGGRAQLQMLDVPDRLIDQPGHVVVEQRIDHSAALTLADHQAGVAQQLELMRDRRLLHPDRGNQF